MVNVLINKYGQLSCEMRQDNYQRAVLLGECNQIHDFNVLIFAENSEVIRKWRILLQNMWFSASFDQIQYHWRMFANFVTYFNADFVVCLFKWFECEWI